MMNSLPARPSPQYANWEELFKRFASLRVLVIGDLMLDRYLWGKVSRISPEAPVPIVDVVKEENRLGGAANVAMNLKGLGTQVVLCGTIGHDREGQNFSEVMAAMHMPTHGLIELSERRTTTKIRVIGNNQQVVRVDKEESDVLPEPIQHRVWQHIEKLLTQEKFDTVIFEDYDKGLLDAEIIERAVQVCVAKHIPVMVDPKRRNFFYYKSSTVFKPNLKELNEALGTHFEKKDLAGIRQAVQLLRHRMPHTHTVITLSEMGVLVCSDTGEFLHEPAHFRQIVDVSGAGDTVVSVLAVCTACGLTPFLAAQVANLAGGLVCEEVGVVPIHHSKLLSEIKRLIK